MQWANIWGHKPVTFKATVAHDAFNITELKSVQLFWNNYLLAGRDADVNVAQSRPQI